MTENNKRTTIVISAFMHTGRDLSSASVKRVREGYILSLPRVIQLD